MAPSKLTILQKIDIPLGMIQALIGTLFTAIAAPFRGPNTPKTLKRHLLLAVTRKVLARLSPEQLQSIAGTTESNYIAWTKAQHVTPRIINLVNIDTKAFWMGDPDAENIVVYYHGGGWNMPGSDGHLTFVSSLISKATTSGRSVAALLLQYDLAPGGQYPRQIVQAVELLRYAVTELGKSPEHVMLMGDSAGGNMIFGVLSHLMHPHPSIKALKLSAPLKAAMICSPVTVLNQKSQRFRTHEGHDPASAETIEIWVSNMLGSSEGDAYTEPLANDAGWWTGLSDVVEEILVTIASNEMMADDTRACADKIKSVYPGLTLFASEVDFHAEPVIGPALGMEEGEASKMMISWAIQRS